MAGTPARRRLARVHSGRALPICCRSARPDTDRAILASNGERIPPWGVPVIVVPADAVLGEDTGSQERLHQAQDALVPDPTSHPAHEGRMVDLVEARFDICLEHPLVIPSGRGEVVDLGDSVLGSALRAEAVLHGLKSASKIGSSTSFNDACTTRSSGSRDPQAADFARRLGDHPSPAPGPG